jgi:hypothetical protein
MRAQTSGRSSGTAGTTAANPGLTVRPEDHGRRVSQAGLSMMVKSQVCPTLSARLN